MDRSPHERVFEGALDEDTLGDVRKMLPERCSMHVCARKYRSKRKQKKINLFCFSETKIVSSKKKCFHNNVSSFWAFFREPKVGVALRGS